MEREAGLPFWFREALAWVRRIGERAPARATAWPAFFDNTDGIGPVKRTLFYKSASGVLLPFKGRPEPVDPAKKIGIEAHITAVRFGTTSAARKFWLKQIQEEVIPIEVARMYGREALTAIPTVAAERMALHQRFWKAPYHFVALLNGDVLFNNDITRYTFAGNGGNGPLVQVSLEGFYPGLERNRKPKHDKLDDFVIETGRAALRLAVNRSNAEGARIGLLYAHRQYSDGRIADPGEAWWREIGIPVAADLGLERRPTFKVGTGLEICREWDPEGRVDYFGRPVP